MGNARGPLQRAAAAERELQRRGAGEVSVEGDRHLHAQRELTLGLDAEVNGTDGHDRDEDPLAPEFWKKSVEKSIGLLQPAAQAEMRRIGALDTTHRLRALAPDGIDHMHAQEETPKPRVNFAFNADSWADSATRLQTRLQSAARTMTQPTPAESMLAHATGLTPKHLSQPVSSATGA